MSDKIFLMSAFNADLVADHFYVPKSNKTEHASMRFVFKMIKEEQASAGLNKATTNKIIADITIDHLTFRYDLYKHYAENFFPKGYQPDYDALGIALICDQYVNRANEPLEGNDDPNIPTRFRDDGFDDAVLLRACSIWEDATTLEAHGIHKAAPPYSHESIFLAHINTLDNARDMEEAFADFSYNDYGHFLKEDLPPLETFIRTGTELGDQVKKTLDALKSKITIELSGTLRTANSNTKPILTLIPSPDAP